jgi:hypothetical protein
LKKYLINYKKSADLSYDKIKWKKEATGCLKKKNFYEDYLLGLKKNQYEKEMKFIQADIDNSKKEFIK